MRGPSECRRGRRGCETPASLKVKQYSLLRVRGVKGRADLAGERIGLPAGQAGERRRELAGGEGIEGAQAGGKFGGGQAALAVEPAEKVSGGAIPFLRVAVQTAGDEVAIGIAAEGHARHNVIEAANQGRKPTQAIETTSAFPHMDGVAQSPGLQEVQLEVDAPREGRGGAAGD